MLNGKPLAIELFCGSFGWSAGWLELGGTAIGFDIDHQDYHGSVPIGAHLVLQDTLTLHGSQFKEADVIFASPPCQKYSYMAMPFSKAKQMESEYRSGARSTAELNELFECCFRIQREACEAAGRHIPLVVENVRGAQAWVGSSRANFGSFHLWGDVGRCGRRVIAGKLSHANAGISPRMKALKTSSEYLGARGLTNNGGSWFGINGSGRKVPNDVSDSIRAGKSPARWTNPDEHCFGTKQGADWFNRESGQSISRSTSSRSKARKAASAMIARIPLPLSRYMAQAFWPLPTDI